MNATPLEVLDAVVARIVENATGHFAIDVANAVRSAYDAPARGTMRAWMEAHNGDVVTTIQARRDGHSWCPTGRTVDARSRQGSVQLSGSTRDYAGCRVLHATDDVLIVTTYDEVIAYVDEDAVTV